MPEKFSAAFTCPNCQQAGMRSWIESTGQSRVMGEGRKLVGVSAGFHIEVGRTASGEPLIVCDVCDEIQLD